MSFTWVFPANPRLPDACSPECVQNCAVGEEADEPVSHRDFMEEGLLGLHNVSVWHPEELHETGIQSKTLVAFEHQPWVCPALPEVYSGCVVLGRKAGDENDGHDQGDPKTDGKGSSFTPLPPFIYTFSIYAYIILGELSYCCRAHWQQ